VDSVQAADDPEPVTDWQRQILRAAKDKHLDNKLRALIEPPPLMEQQGWQLWQQGKMAEAAEMFQKAVEIDPKSENAWNGLGWASFNSGKRSEAIVAFRQVLKLNPAHPAALNGMGQILLAERKYNDAEGFLLKAAPNAPAAWWGLTRLYLLQGKYDQAERWAQKIVDAGQADDILRQMLDAAKKKTTRRQTPRRPRAAECHWLCQCSGVV